MHNQLALHSVIYSLNLKKCLVIIVYLKSGVSAILLTSGNTYTVYDNQFIMNL